MRNPWYVTLLRSYVSFRFVILFLYNKEEIKFVANAKIEKVNRRTQSKKIKFFTAIKYKLVDIPIWFTFLIDVKRLIYFVWMVSPQHLHGFFLFFF
jgi:hypothetical protein